MCFEKTLLLGEKPVHLVYYCYVDYSVNTVFRINLIGYLNTI